MYNGYMVRQLDGEYIDIRQCTCPPLFVREPWIGSVDCPVDWHRTTYLQATWEDEDDGRNAVRVDVPGYE